MWNSFPFSLLHSSPIPSTSTASTSSTSSSSSSSSSSTTTNSITSSRRNSNNQFQNSNNSNPNSLSSTANQFNNNQSRKRERSRLNSNQSLSSEANLQNNFNLNSEIFDNELAEDERSRYELEAEGGNNTGAIQLNSNFEQEQEEQDEEEDRISNGSNKRRKTLTSIFLDTLIYGGVLSIVLPYTAYQFFKDPSSLYEENDLTITDSPPPYEQLPRQIESNNVRRVRHIHSPRPRPSMQSRKSSSPSLLQENLSILLPPRLTTTNYDQSITRINYPLPQFLPIESGIVNQGGEEVEEEEDENEMDEEMLAMGERLKSLINSGREALLFKAPSTSTFTSSVSGNSTSRSNGSSIKSPRHSSNSTRGITSPNSSPTLIPSPTKDLEFINRRRDSGRFEAQFDLSPTLNSNSNRSSNNNGRISPIKMDRGLSLPGESKLSLTSAKEKKRNSSYGGASSGSENFGVGNEILDDILLKRDLVKGWWEK